MPIFSQHPVDSIVIAGAGGFGLEIFDYVAHTLAQQRLTFAGFIDDTPGDTLPNGMDAKHLGTIDAYCPRPKQGVIVAIGSVEGRKLVLNKLWNKGAITPTLTAEYSLISPTANIGKGVIVGPMSSVQSMSTIGDGVLINCHCNVGHEASIGSYSVLCPYAALNGRSSIGAECFLGTGATLYPNVTLGDGCTVDCHTGVRADASDRMLISCRGSYHAMRKRL